MNALIFFLLTLFWGGSFLAIKFSVTEIPPYLAASMRVMTALLFLLIARFIYYKKYSFVGIRKNMVFSILVGFFNLGIAWCFLFWGERSTQPALASIINGSYPIWLLLICLIFNIEEVTRTKILAVVLGFIGITIVFFPKIQLGMSSNLSGALAIWAMAISYAIGGAILKRFSAHILTLPHLIIQCIAALFITLPMSYFFEYNDWKLSLEASSRTYISTTYLGIFSTALATLLYFRLIKSIGAIRSSYITFCVPFVSIILDILVLGMPPHMNEIAGLFIILSGIFLNSYFDGRRKKEASLSDQLVVQATLTNQSPVSK